MTLQREAAAVELKLDRYKVDRFISVVKVDRSVLSHSNA